MTPLSDTPVVSGAWLEPRLAEPGLVILDTSWYLPTAGRDGGAEYLAAHLPGARRFDLDQASDPTSPLPHMLPRPDAFAAYVSSLGISNDSRVVVYDGSGTNLSAARVWWMFRAFGHREVAVLDGGLGKWRADGRGVDSGPVRGTPARFEARFDPRLVLDAAGVARALAEGTAQVVDLRPAGRYRGIDPEPRPGLSSGHMPGARSLPYTELVAPDGTVLPVDEVRGRMARAGIVLDRPMIAYCGSGTSACNLMLALARLGAGEARLYDGSWTDWAGSGRPIATGEG